MSTLVRFLLLALALAPGLSVWEPASADGSSVVQKASEITVTSVGEAAGSRVFTSPTAGGGHENDGEEEAALDADDHYLRTKPAHGAVFRSSNERTIHYPTYRPPRRPLV